MLEQLKAWWAQAVPLMAVSAKGGCGDDDGT